MKSPKTILTSFSLLLALCFTSPLFAQAQGHELGVIMGGLNNFNFIYKKQKVENRYMRFSAGSFQSNFTTDSLYDRLSLNLFVAIGCERRVPIVGKLKFFHGPEPYLGISGNFLNVKSSSVGEDETEIRLSPGFGYILGFMYDISDRFYVGIETAPSISITGTIRNGKISDRIVAGLGFNSNAVAISFVYKFQKAKKEKR